MNTFSAYTEVFIGLVSVRQTRLLCADKSNCPGTSSRHYFVNILSNLWIVKSFQFPFCSESWALGRRSDVDVLRGPALLLLYVPDNPSLSE